MHWSYRLTYQAVKQEETRLDCKLVTKTLGSLRNMASMFSVPEKGGTCQNPDCRRTSGTSTASYRVQEMQELCRECVENKPCGATASRVLVPTGKEWFCDKHEEKGVEFYCVTHSVALCQACAFLSHQKPCDVVDIQDAIRKKRSKMEGLLTQVNEGRHRLKEKNSRINQCKSDVSTHLLSVEKSIDNAFGMERDKMRDEERKASERINESADEEIRKIEEEREEKLENLSQKTFDALSKINRNHKKTMSEIYDTRGKVYRKIDSLTEKFTSLSTSLEEMQSRLDDLLLSDKKLINEPEQFETTLTEAVEADFDLEPAERIAHFACKLRFDTEYDGDGAQSGKLSGVERSWALTDTVPIQKDLGKPYFVGAVGADQMAISDLSTRMLYVTDLSTGATEKVLECPLDKTIASCTPFAHDAGKILCGNYCSGASGETFKGASIYSINHGKEWTLLRDVEIPKKTSLDKTFACASQLWEGDKVILAEACQSHLNVVDQTNGSIVSTVNIEGKTILWICALSLGDCVVKTGNGEFVIVDHHGRPTKNLKKAEWDGCLCDVDPYNNIMYVVYRDVSRGVYAVDEVSCNDGTISETPIVEYPFSDRKDVVLPCVMTSSGKLVTCNGENFFVYQTRSPFD